MIPSTEIKIATLLHAQVNTLYQKEPKFGQIFMNCCMMKNTGKILTNLILHDFWILRANLLELHKFQTLWNGQEGVHWRIVGKVRVIGENLYDVVHADSNENSTNQNIFSQL